MSGTEPNVEGAGEAEEAKQEISQVRKILPCFTLLRVRRSKRGL